MATTPIEQTTVGQVGLHAYREQASAVPWQVTEPLDVPTLVAAVRGVQREWEQVPVRARAKAALRLHARIFARRDEIAQAIVDATGKPYRDAILEVSNGLVVCRYFGLNGARMLRPRRHGLTGTLVPLLHAGVERRVPLGVIGNIAAWNYPFIFMLGDTIPMLIAGNAVVLKPAPPSTAVAQLVQELIREAGMPDGLVGIVAGGTPALGEALVDEADHILFTGSTATGSLVAERAARTLTSCTLELGGKNGAYVADDANLDVAATALVQDCFTNAGQSCTATERLFVHDAVYDRFVGKFLAKIHELRIGDDDQAQFGALITEQHCRNVSELVRDAIDKGATLLTGGSLVQGLDGRYFQPTVLAEVPPTARVDLEESFGPVVSVYRVYSDEEAIERISESDAGLMASVWTRGLRRGRRIAGRLRVGTVVVNENFVLAWGSVGLPIGGVGSSGYGRRYGIEGLREVTRAHVTIEQRWSIVRTIMYRPGPIYPKIVYGYTALMRALRWR